MLTEVDKAEIDLWTSKDLWFVDNGCLKKILPYTECQKIKYNSKIKQYLEVMEEKNTSSGTAVAVKLDGKVRYVWRSDLLNRKQFDEIRKKQRSRLRVFSKKSKGAMGEGA